jgi:hypothetical protein
MMSRRSRRAFSSANKKGQIMNALTDWIAYWNRKVRKLTIFDVKLVQGTAMAFALIIVKLFPPIMSLSIWWFVAFAVIFALRPLYVIWMTDDPPAPA